MDVNVKVVGAWDTTWNILNIRVHVMTFYYTRDFGGALGEFGLETCPHNLYLTNISVKSNEDLTGVEVVLASEDGTQQSIGTLLGNTGNYCYLRPGTYTLTATVQSKKYSKTFTIDDKAVNVILQTDDSATTDPDKPGTTNPDIPDVISPSNPSTEKPDIPTGGKIIASGECGAEGDNVTWTKDENGVLTISGTGKMRDYTMSSMTPWNTNGGLKDIQTIVIEEGITRIGNHAFEDCWKMEMSLFQKL